nr:hypothetical protein [uncultured Desulfobacter sp.]
MVSPNNAGAIFYLGAILCVVWQQPNLCALGGLKNEIPKGLNVFFIKPLGLYFAGVARIFF